MESEANDWEQDLPLDADEAYRSLVRSLKRTEGFALLFVRCSPVQGDQIITDVRTDLPSKIIEVLELKESIDNLYDHVAALPNREQINVLFIKGIEYSIFAYEDREMNDVSLRSQSSGYGGTWQGIPRILGHLNLSRERFRDDFKFCFVFLLPEFALRYFIRRAPDFFDWRSNIYEFPTKTSLVDQECYRLVFPDGGYEKYFQQTQSQRTNNLIQIKSYIDETSDPQNVSRLWFVKALIHTVANENEEALISSSNSLRINPKSYIEWNIRGSLLWKLGRYEEAIVCCDKSLQIKSDQYLPRVSRGILLNKLSRYKEAIESFDKALEINDCLIPEAWFGRGVGLNAISRYEEAIISFDRALRSHTNLKPKELNNRDAVLYESWYNRGVSLSAIGRYEEAILSYDKALEIKPSYYLAWDKRGDALSQLSRYEDAVFSYDKVLEIDSKYFFAWTYRGLALWNSGRREDAIVSFDKTLKLNPNEIYTWNFRGIALFNLGRYKEAIDSFDKSLKIKPDLHEAWINRGNTLGKLGRNEEAIACYEQALQIKPDKHEAWYNKACAYSLQNAIEFALENLQKAIQLNPEKYREMAKTDSDFDNIRHDPRFQALIQ